MSATQFLDWQVYAEIEPFGEVRADYRAAAGQALLANINRDRKNRPQPFKVEDFLLRFEASEGRRKQTWQEQKAIMKLVAAAFAQPKKAPRRKAAAAPAAAAKRK